MNIPRKYEDVVAQLDAALGREAALLEERDNSPDVSIKNCIFEGQNANGSQAFEFETLEGGLKKLTKINLDGWVCYGPSGESAVASLQQRLTVAEQWVADLKKLLCDVINEAPTGFAALKVDLANRVNDALKPAAEGEGNV